MAFVPQLPALALLYSAQLKVTVKKQILYIWLYSSDPGIVQQCSSSSSSHRSAAVTWLLCHNSDPMCSQLLHSLPVGNPVQHCNSLEAIAGQCIVRESTDCGVLDCGALECKFYIEALASQQPAAVTVNAQRWKRNCTQRACWQFAIATRRYIGDGKIGGICLIMKARTIYRQWAVCTIFNLIALSWWWFSSQKTSDGWTSSWKKGAAGRNVSFHIDIDWEPQIYCRKTTI